jgi:hypothetical protein
MSCPVSLLCMRRCHSCHVPLMLCDVSLMPRATTTVMEAVPMDDALRKALGLITTWDFDVFDVNRLCPKDTLLVVGMSLLQVHASVCVGGCSLCTSLPLAPAPVAPIGPLAPAPRRSHPAQACALAPRIATHGALEVWVGRALNGSRCRLRCRGTLHTANLSTPLLSASPPSPSRVHLCRGWTCCHGFPSQSRCALGTCRVYVQACSPSVLVNSCCCCCVGPLSSHPVPCPTCSAQPTSTPGSWLPLQL